MSKKSSIVWGVCWLNEPTDILIRFIKNTVRAISSFGFFAYPVIFDAKYERSVDEVSHISKRLGDCLVIPNKINIYPNKNYGVAAISQFAYDLNAEYVAVVDPDWQVEEYSTFIQQLLRPLYKNHAQIVIPDIGAEAGRSNLLIGKPTVALFYPEYADIIQTAFPGSLVGLTETVHSITASTGYHFDWGGEWDVISIAASHNIKIASSPANVENTRHRSNASKSFDAFQIWRAVFSSDDLVNRYGNLHKFQDRCIPFDQFSEILLKCRLSARDQIELINRIAVNDTQRQLLYMILYPIASILQEIHSIPPIQQSGSLPYDKDEISRISMLAPYCVKSALMCSLHNIKEIGWNAKHLTGQFWSNWDEASQVHARKAAADSFKRGGRV